VETPHTRIAALNAGSLRPSESNLLPKPQKLNRRQARWAIELAEYDIDLKHIPGNKNIPANALSRRPDLCPNEDNDNEDVVLLSEDLFIRLIDMELLNAVANAQKGDSTALEAL
jgi:hypothetical protein